MPLTETDRARIIQIFEDIADMLEILGENVFRVRAYRRGAEAVRNSSADLLIERVPGIGDDLHAKIKEIHETNGCEMHARLLEKLSPGILDLLHVRGLGPKKVKLFWEQLGITTLEALKSAAESGALATLPGMGEKSEQAILESLSQNTYEQKRIPYATALAQAEAYIEYMKLCPALEQIAYAGSLRCKRETIGDIDLLVQGSDPALLSAHFLAYPKVHQILAQGDTKSSVVIDHNTQVDFRVVDAESFGAALFYFTGPKHFNIHVRTIALKKGLKVNEYGLFKSEEKLAGRTEEDMFAGLEIPYLSPEEREEKV